jgi:hypothetical protein
MSVLTDTSADGALDARYPTDRRGVFLRAKFPEAYLFTNDFEVVGTPITHNANGISGAFFWKPVAIKGLHQVTYDAPGSSASALQWCGCVFKSNGTAITVDTATVAQVTSTTALGGAATATFNVSANTLVAVLISYDAATADTAGDKVTVTNNKSLTVVKVVERGHKEAGSLNGGSAIAYMYSTGSQTGMTVTVTLAGINSSDDNVNFKVLLLGNVDSTTPVPAAAQEGFSITNATLLSALSTVDQGLAVWAATDNAGLGAPTVTEGAWAVSSGTGTLTLNSSSPLSGTRDLKLAWTTAGTQAVKRTLATAEQITGGRMIRVLFTITTSDPPSAYSPTGLNYARLRVKAYDKNGKLTDQKTLPHPGLNTTRSNWFVDFWLASSATMGAVEIGIDSAAASKQFQVDNFRILATAPPKIRFIRKTDGGYVRGGNPAEAVQGTAYAFDDELTPGQLTLWSAQPVFDTEWKYPTPLYYGPETGTVDFTIDNRDLTLLPSHLIKSVETPGLLLYLTVNQKEIGKSRQATFVNKQTDGKPAGGISSAYSLSGSYQLNTLTVQEKHDLEAILDEAVLYIQPPGQYNRAPFYATVTGYGVKDVGKMSDVEKIFVIDFQEVERPDTFGQPNYVPLRDYAWLAGQYTTYADAGLTSQTYDQLAFSAVT